MDIQFQDRIDDFLLNRMDEGEKKAFLREVEKNAEKREQLEFTRQVKESIASRTEKLQALNVFRQEYEKGRDVAAVPQKSKKKIGLWISGVAALLAVCFFAVKPVVDSEPSPVSNTESLEGVRGGDEVFNALPADSTGRDTIPNHQIIEQR